MQIQKTKNYDSFKKIKGNRKINRKHVEDLRESFKKHNLGEFMPAVVNEKGEIIDGQHRLERARADNDYFYYIILEEAEFDEVRLINAAQRGWSAWDFLRAYVNRGNEHYIKIDKFVKETDMPLWWSIRKITNRKDWAKESQLFRNGEITVSDEKIKYYKVFARILHKIRPYVEGTRTWKSNFLLAAFEKVYKEQPERIEPLIESIQKYPEKLRYFNNTRDYLFEFERRYNVRTGGKKMVRFT